MKFTSATIGLKIVKSKDINYDNGEYGQIVDTDPVKFRVRVDWKSGHSWLKVDKVEPEHVPHKIVPAMFDNRGVLIRPKYVTI